MSRKPSHGLKVGDKISVWDTHKDHAIRGLTLEAFEPDEEKPYVTVAGSFRHALKDEEK